jgi:sensor histidine kinase YesM
MINDSILKLIDWIAHHEHDNFFFFVVWVYFCPFVVLNWAYAWGMVGLMFFFLYCGFSLIGFLLGKVEIKFNIKLKSYQELWEKLNKSEKKYKR